MSTPERRQFERFPLAGKNVAAFRSKNGKVIVGPIKNISRGGLFFEYTDIHIAGIAIDGTVDVYMSESDFYLPDIPCKIVHSIEVLEENYSIAIPVPKMCCGLEFGELVEEKHDYLESLLSEMKS